MNRKWVFALPLTVVLAILVYWLALRDSGRASEMLGKSSTPVDIKIVQINGECRPQEILVMAARDQGLFEKHSLHATVESKMPDEDGGGNGNGNGGFFQEVRAADVFSVGRAMSYKLQSHHVGRFKAVAAAFIDGTVQDFAILVPKNSKLTSLDGFQGKFALPKSTGKERGHLGNEVLAVVGSGKTEIVDLDDAQLAKGDYAAALVSMQKAGELIKAGNVRVLQDHVLSKLLREKWPQGYIMVAGHFIADHADAARRLYRTMEETIDVLRAKPEYADQLYARCLKEHQRAAGEGEDRRMWFWKGSEIPKDVVQFQFEQFRKYGSMADGANLKGFYYNPDAPPKAKRPVTESEDEER